MLRLAVMVLALTATGALAQHTHNEPGAAWIKKNFNYCCGKEDCFPVAPERVSFTPGGWKIKGIPGNPLDRDVHHQSPDGQPWVCVYGEIETPFAVRCLFLPGARQ